MGTDRILSLPFKKPFEPAYLATFEGLLRLPGGTMELWPLQAEALYEALMARGLVAMMGVGSGKTLTSALLPTVLGAKRPLVLTRATLVEQQYNAYREYRHHWDIVPGIVVLGYEHLSGKDGMEALRAIDPDLVIADEAHRVSRESARTMRLFDFFMEKDEAGDPPEFCALSGTLFRRRIEDMWRPFFLALGDNSPIPYEPQTRRVWGWALDTKQKGRKSYEQVQHAQRKLAPIREQTRGPIAGVPDLVDAYDILGLNSSTQRLRDAVRRRAYATQGVMGSEGLTLPHGLEIYGWRPELPTEVQAVLDDFDDLWMRPDGEFIDDAMGAAEFRRQVSAGFYYRWDWPDGKPDVEWLERRSDWHRWVRREIDNYRREGYDTPALVRAEAEKSPPPELLRWKEVEHRPEPPQVVEWISDQLVKDAVNWLEAQDQPTILWSSHTAIMDKVADLIGSRYVYPADKALNEHTRDKWVVATVHAHGEGKNLQYYSNQLVLHPACAGLDWEQLIGRTDRPGQQADTVRVYVAAYCDQYRQDLQDARHDAKGIEVLTGIRQRLNKATWVDL